MNSDKPLCEAAYLLVHASNRLRGERNFLASYTCAKRAHAIEPDHYAPMGCIGSVLWNMGRFEEGEGWLKRAVERCGDNGEYWAHLALCYSSQEKDEEAERAYRKAIECRPDDLAITWNRSNFDLARGEWARGLKDYESRIEYRGEPAYPKPGYPLWNGEDLSGKTLVIIGEQGVGDTIFSSRLIPELKKRWPTAKLLWLVQPRLHDLLWEYSEYITFMPLGYPWPAMKADYSVFQMSLWGLLGVSPSNPVADPKLVRRRAVRQWESVRLPDPHIRGSLKIGVSWTGNPNMLANEVRSIPLEMLMPIAEDPRFTLYSLQVGEEAGHIYAGGAQDLVRDLSVDLKDASFVGTAATMLNLDLVLTVCTSNAHLAGALGVPCWTMLAKDCYWVWGREGNSTPWYPGMKLFRQHTAGDWSSVVDDVKSALISLVEQKLAA